jgi:hypothetical protein
MTSQDSGSSIQNSGTGRRAAEGSDPLGRYTTRLAEFTAARATAEARWSRVANARLLAFLTAAACAGLALWYRLAWLGWFAGLFLAAFFVLVVLHNRLSGERRRYAALQGISQEGLWRLQRDWARLPLRQPTDVPADDAMARDLDLLGTASLQHLLNTPRTPAGLATLQAWLLIPADPSTIALRQAGVAELAPAIDWRDELAVVGEQVREDTSRYERFQVWATSPLWILKAHGVRWAARLSPLLLIAGGIAQITLSTPLPLWLPFLALNIGLNLFYGVRIAGTLGQLIDRQELLAAYARLFGLALDRPATAPALVQVQTRLNAGSLRADRQLRRLSRIALLAELTRSILFPLLQYLLLWGFHVTDLAERWRQVAGPHLHDWLAALGEIEALAALAALRHDHPTWQFPTVTPHAHPTITARALAHPLLPPRHSVPNDVRLGPPGRFLLITGSNMAGKSTLLRAIGTNIVLAQAGAPVYAAALELPPIRLATSMRVQDSLAQGVSYFMAELRRLKAVVDIAAGADRASAVCYLLDEILHGTNSAERQIAARRVIRHLVELGAIGAVSTHDLTLADDPRLAATAVQAHFGERVSEQSADLGFDYILRPGQAPTTNALRLMALVGLPADE